MRRLFLILALLGASPASAADSTVANLTAASALTGTELIYCVQGGADRKCTPTQLSTYIQSLVTGDCTIAANSITCTKTGGVAFAASATTNTTIASNISSGTLADARLSTNIPLKNAANTFSAVNTYGAGGLVLTSATGCASFSAGVLSGTGTACGSGSSTITAGTTATSGFTSGNLIGSSGSLAVDSGLAYANIPTKSGANTFSGTNTFGAGGIVLTGGSGCATFSTGTLTSTGAACGGSGSTGANPSATAGPTAINGTAGTFMRSDAAPAVQVGSASQQGILQVDGTTIKAAAGVISAPPAVSSRTVSGTTDTILAADLGNVVYYTSTSAVAVTQPAPSGSFAAGFFTTLCDTAAGVTTVTPASGTIGGAASLPIAAGTNLAPVCYTYQSNGTNFLLIPSNLLPSAPGTGVGVAIGTTLSAAGGLASTIASGTATLGTTAIASGACATVVTVTATNVVTTDVLSFGYNGDPSAVTGYGASASGAVLTVYPYPSAGNVNVKVCNSTSASITPGALTLNWRVWR